MGAGEKCYRYNGKELVEDLELEWYAYGVRYYDPAIGRFTGVDPIADQFPQVSTYNYAENEPIANIDLWGLQKYPAHKAESFTKKYPNTTAFLSAGGLTKMVNDGRVLDQLVKYSANKKSSLEILTDLSFGRGPTLNFRQLDQTCGKFCNGAFGYAQSSDDEPLMTRGLLDRDNTIEIDEDLVLALEDAINSGDSEEINRQLLLFSSTVLHEYTHFANGGSGMFGESGQEFEGAVWGIQIDQEITPQNVYDRSKDGELPGANWTKLMETLSDYFSN